MADPAAIELENVSVGFNGRAVLDGFSLSVARGERVVLAGRSGCGKSTVLKCVLGFVAPEAGAVRVGGEAVSGESVWRVRTRLAYVAQESELGEGAVREVLERPFAYRANAHLRDSLDGASALFERFLLSPKLLGEDIDGLSGGEKQRVAIVLALLLRRPILLLDEPSSALDAKSREAVLDYLRSESDATILAVSHDAQGFDLGGRVVTLPGGSDEGVGEDGRPQ